jgi:hypothetical protein
VAQEAARRSPPADDAEAGTIRSTLCWTADCCIDPPFNLGLQVPARDIGGPVITDDDLQRVEYWTKRVTHHVPCAFSAVHFQFRSDESVSSFSINCRLVAANIREPITRALHIELSVTESEAPAPPLEDEE